ncbi:MAG: SDR family oxidoreductase [Bacteroidota bacterium]|nr:SDR family oxidoreductase [Bacteroidota bacterium]
MTTKRTALITGASGGIGYELAKLFAKDGCNLVLVARNADKLQTIASNLQTEYAVTAHIVPLNLSLPNSPDELFQFTQRHNIAVDYLVNNAGFGLVGKFVESDLSTELEMIQLNVTALTHLTKLFAKEMVKRKFGKIMNIASTAAFQAGPLMAVYYASKAYVLSFSEAIANELKGTGVSVTVVCPGPTVTEFGKRAKVENTKLFAFGAMSAQKVAKIGYRALMSGKTIVVTGVKNKMFAQSVRLAPRKITASIARYLQEIGE